MKRRKILSFSALVGRKIKRVSAVSEEGFLRNFCCLLIPINLFDQLKISVIRR
ncbi:hypothetical protein GJU40_19650 [Bacillus lacus]|uniref:Uncharacterized protein n=1 Tax=Metabacillus lacus TaxID=1983721 RepID=A0A7X2J356_9BACI|nr:hypothetical protein [Metabacillus lacus]MRX74337.1 hypothetical protein [Metabacillus lacus]